MDLFKAITGKNPAEYEQAAGLLVNTPDVELYKKLVKQEDFLFDFVRNNVAKRIQHACNRDNYRNLLKFTDFYSPSYDSVIAEVLNQYGGDEIFGTMENLYLTGNNSQKAYAAKYFLFSNSEKVKCIIEYLRKNAESEDDAVSSNSIEVLAKLGDEVSKKTAIKKLESEDEFEQYEGIKFLVTYQAKDTLDLMLKVMKKSSLAENIASEIIGLMPFEELTEQNFDASILVMCNILNGVPEIIHPSFVPDINLLDMLEYLYYEKLTSTSALLLRMAKDKISSLAENDEYLFDCDKNTKEEIFAINKFLSQVNIKKLDSLLYEELYEDSDFVFFALDYTNDAEEIETLLDSTNQTLVLKALTRLKDKNMLSQKHKDIAMNSVSNNDIKTIISVL